MERVHYRFDLGRSQEIFQKIGITESTKYHTRLDRLTKFVFPRTRFGAAFSGACEVTVHKSIKLICSSGKSVRSPGRGVAGFHTA
jgi:hypothetical protein